MEPEGSSPQDFILRRVNPVHTFIFYILKIRFSIFCHLCLCLPNILVLSDFIVSSMRAAYPAHLSLRDMITLIVSGEECTLRRSSTYNFIQPPPDAFLPLRSKYSLKKPVLEHPNLCSMTDQVLNT